MMIIANVLHEMIFTSESFRTPVAVAILAGVLGSICVELFKVTMEDIQPREATTALTGIRDMLLLFGMPQKVCL
jgi:hypothetical protein